MEVSSSQKFMSETPHQTSPVLSDDESDFDARSSKSFDSLFDSRSTTSPTSPPSFDQQYENNNQEAELNSTRVTPLLNQKKRTDTQDQVEELHPSEKPDNYQSWVSHNQRQSPDSPRLPSEYYDEQNMNKTNTKDVPSAINQDEISFPRGSGVSCAADGTPQIQHRPRTGDSQRLATNDHRAHNWDRRINNDASNVDCETTRESLGIDTDVIIESEGSSVVNQEPRENRSQQMERLIHIEKTVASQFNSVLPVTETVQHHCAKSSQGRLPNSTDVISRQTKCVPKIHQNSSSNPFDFAMNSSSRDVPQLSRLGQAVSRQDLTQSDLLSESGRTHEGSPKAIRNLRKRPVAHPQVCSLSGDLGTLSDDEDTDGIEDEEDEDYAHQPQRKGRKTLSGRKMLNVRHKRSSDISALSSRSPYHRENSADTPTAAFDEWPLENAVLKRITDGSHTTFQIQFAWAPCATHHLRHDGMESPRHQRSSGTGLSVEQQGVSPADYGMQDPAQDTYEEYAVEQIRNHRFAKPNNQGLQLQVKWRNSQQLTWEPVEAMEDTAAYGTYLQHNDVSQPPMKRKRGRPRKPRVESPADSAH